jgi:hypothetical protein
LTLSSDGGFYLPERVKEIKLIPAMRGGHLLGVMGIGPGSNAGQVAVVAERNAVDSGMLIEIVG